MSLPWWRSPTKANPDAVDYQAAVQLDPRYADRNLGVADLAVAVLARRLDTRRILNRRHPLSNLSPIPRTVRWARMTGPKHLWSGNWREESEAASQRRARRQRQPEDTDTQSPPAREDERRRRTTLPILLVALMFLVAAGIGLAAVLNSGSKNSSTSSQASVGTATVPGSTNPGFTNPGSTNPGSTNPGSTNPGTTVPGQASPLPNIPTPSPTQPSTTPTPTTPATQSHPVSWLGMEIETLPPGAAVIETVALGSAGDRAGLNPGDVIIAINGRAIQGADDIAAAIKGLPRGDQVPIQISHGSTLEQTEITLAAPPTPHP